MDGHRCTPGSSICWAFLLTVKQDTVKTGNRICYSFVFTVKNVPAILTVLIGED